MLKTVESVEKIDLQNKIETIEMLLESKVAELDTIYVQIKIHHDSSNYHESFKLYDLLPKIKHDFEVLESKLRLYKEVSNLNRIGIPAKVVKR